MIYASFLPVYCAILAQTIDATFITSNPQLRTVVRFGRPPPEMSAGQVFGNRRYPSAPLAHIVIVGFAKESSEGM